MKNVQEELLTDLEKAAIAWAKQRKKYQKATHLGKASSRAAVFRKAEKLSKLAFEIELEDKEGRAMARC